MKKLLSLSIVLLLVSAFTAINPQIEGTWVATIENPNGETEITYNFEVDGDTLTGTVVSGMGENEILNGQVDGNQFSFDTEFNQFTINHECELVDENTINMTFQFGQQGGQGGGPGPQEITLTRATEEE